MMEVPQVSPRLRQVWLGIASGKPHKQVASEMGISDSSFATYRKILYKRIHAHSKVEATVIAFRSGNMA